MPAKNAAPASVSFDATLSKSTKRFGVFNQPDDGDGSPKGIVYLPKALYDQLGADSITVTVTPNK